MLAPADQAIGLIGHKSTYVTETVYRHVIVPVIPGSDRDGCRLQ